MSIASTPADERSFAERLLAALPPRRLAASVAVSATARHCSSRAFKPVRVHGVHLFQQLRIRPNSAQSGSPSRSGQAVDQEPLLAQGRGLLRDSSETVQQVATKVMAWRHDVDVGRVCSACVTNPVAIA
eukprot:14881867-Alexandrium_andersonii.AAC.1